ncbi:protein NDH-DEPENDENT CYCLIC ELECTRON FLOW 5 [Impatiens glandulifera]|uniref:protein NDH-DEPENDENT CYCLIC ELECTRON FLOW 5 n=1 Tax=Impatiens glandulifera TaxID=253017 RepID=UPI001FB0564E|nr:protein NDH-DEPENDENT CYCLIC ELECTRON FLOW 5 [Impatiens glandulifera]
MKAAAVAQIAPVISPNLTPVLGLKRSLQITCQQSPSSNHNQDHNFPSFMFKRTTKKDNPPSALASDIPYIPSINIDYSNLETEFKENGVTFEEISLTGTNSNCLVLKMTLQNGSTAALMLPSGLITSYKTPLWHGGQAELLHTCVSKRANSTDVNVQGGVSLSFDCEIEGLVSTWSPSIWDLSSIRGGQDQEFIQVELKSSNWDKTVEVKHIVTIREDVLTSELVFSNKSLSNLRLTGSVITHLGVSTPDATYALGLEGSNYYSKPPLSSTFCITLPDSDLSKSKNWSLGDLNKGKQAEIVDGEENENYKQLTDAMSRIYTCAPRQLTIMDRGKRNSIILRRDGFEELYLFSPGSDEEWYGKYAYICVGQSALLQPVILAPGDKWNGSQHIHNPNL